MSITRQTGLAGQVLVWAEKVHATETPILQMQKTLEALGEDYADCADQASLAINDLDQLYDRLLDLAAMILKADRVRTQAQDDGHSSPEDDAGPAERPLPRLK